MRVLVTGAAGFIGFHLARRLLAEGHRVSGLDAVTPYYDVALKRDRLAILARSDAFVAHEFMLEDMNALSGLIASERPEVVVHLAAQAGVRHSLEHPRAYVESNIVGTFNLLEAVRAAPPRHLLLASTSSVYGSNETLPFRETDGADHPLTVYAASKRSTELMAHASAHLWNLPCTVLRLFTVYGPWGRPDMALFKFVRAILRDEPINVHGHGRMERDFTYVDDLVEAIVRLVPLPPTAFPPADDDAGATPRRAPFRVVNIGGGKPVSLLDFIEAIEAKLGRQARRNLLPMQTGDVARTSAAVDRLVVLTGYRPDTPVDAGVSAFVDWYLDYYGEAGASG